MEKKPKYIEKEANFNKEFSRLKELKRNAEKYWKSTKGLLSLAEKTKEEIEELSSERNSVVSEVEEIKTFYEEFKPLRDNVNDKETGVEVLFNDIKLKKESIDTFKIEITKIDKRIKELQKESAEILKTITDGSLANTFGMRAKSINWSRRLWGTLSIISSIGLFLALFGIYWFDIRIKENISLDGLMVFRVILTTPLIYLLIFATTQYSKERSLLEKYEFKSRVAQSLKSYTKLLRDEFFEAEDNEEVIRKFVVETTKMIYEEPYKVNLKKNKNFKFKSPIAQIDLCDSEEEENLDKEDLKN